MKAFFLGPFIVAGSFMMLAAVSYIIIDTVKQIIQKLRELCGFNALAKMEPELEKSEHGLDRDLDRAELERIAKEHLLETDNTSPSKKDFQAYIAGIPEERQNSTQQGEAVNERATNVERSCLEPEMDGS